MKVAGPGALEGPATMNDAPRDFRPRVRLVAWALLSTGLLIYATYRITHSQWLVIAGMCWIPIGCLFVLVGLVDLRRSPSPQWRTTLLLFSNFPVAILCTVSAVAP